MSIGLFESPQPLMELCASPARGSGLSAKVILAYSRLVESNTVPKDHILVLKAKGDDPEHGSKIVSKSLPEKTVQAHEISGIEELVQLITPEIEIVMLNGAHHLNDPQLAVVLHELVQSGRKVLVTGTMMNGVNTPHFIMGEIAAYADIHTWSRIPCSVGQGCQERSSRTIPHLGVPRPACYLHVQREEGLPDHKGHCFGQIGAFTMYIGSMYAEKTEELAHIITLTKIPCALFKSDFDTKLGDGKTNVSRNHTKTPAELIRVADGYHNAWKIHEIVHEKGLRAVFIDEPFMFGDKIPEVIERLVWEGVQVTAGSITTSYENKPFPVIPKLLCLADEVVDCYAFCSNKVHRGKPCGLSATRNQRWIQQGTEYLPISAGATTFLAGQEYSATCRNDLVIPKYRKPIHEFPPVKSSSVPHWKLTPRYLRDNKVLEHSA